MQVKRVIAYCEPYAWAFARFSKETMKQLLINRNFDGRDQHHDVHDTDHLNSKGYEVSQLLCTTVKMGQKALCVCVSQRAFYCGILKPILAFFQKFPMIQLYSQTDRSQNQEEIQEIQKKKTIPVNYYLYFLFV